MHKIIHAMTLAVLAATASLAPSPAQATSDAKGISGSQCRPLTATDATGLVFDTRGAINTTTVNKRVICNILNDAEIGYTVSNDAILQHFIKAGSIDGSVSCTYYLGPVDFPAFAAVTYTADASATAGLWISSSVDITTYAGAAAGWRNVGTTAVCTLSGKMTLAFFRVFEYGSTNTP